MKRKGDDTWWLGALLTLPILVIILLRVLYFSVQAQRVDRLDPRRDDLHDSKGG